VKAILKKLLPNNRFAGSVSVLAGGTASGQLIVIAASPILTRLYTPEDFGLLAVYTGILGIIGVIASMRYQLAIPLPQSDQEAASITVLSLIVVAVTTLCSAIYIWLLGGELVNLLNSPILGDYLWLIPTGLFVTGVYQVFQYWALRKNEYSKIARTRLTQSLVMVTIQLTGYLLGPIALLVGRVLGQSAGVWSLIKSALRKNSEDFGNTNEKKIWGVAREYRNFPLVSTWTGLASSGGSNLPPILIAAFLGAGPAGMYALAHRVLSQPMSIIGHAVGDVFYRQAAEAYRDGTLDTTVNRVYTSLVKIALPPALIAFLLIPDLFVFVFGENWYIAGEVSRWMIPWLFCEFVVTPSTRVYPILGLHGIALRFQLALLLSATTSSVIGGGYFKSVVLIVTLMSAFNFLIYLWRASLTFGLVGLKKRTPIYILVKAIPSSLFCCLPILFLLTIYEDVFSGGLLSFLMISMSVFMTMTFVTFSLKKALS